MYAAFAEMARVELTLYTDALITKGLYRTRQHRVTDILNRTETPFLVLEEVTVADIGSDAPPIRAQFAQINLDAVLFAVADVPVVPVPELRTPKFQQRAIVSIPPFRVVGTIHLLPTENGLREALTELTGRFIPVTDATYWSDQLKEPRRQAIALAVNHQRAQIFAQLDDEAAALGPATEPEG